MKLDSLITMSYPLSRKLFPNGGLLSSGGDKKRLIFKFKTEQ